jgi:photosystem I subunit PsaN
MAGVNSSVVGLKPAAAVPQSANASPAAAKRVQVAPAKDRRSALLGLAAVFAVTAATGSANASVFDEYLEKSKLNKVCALFHPCRRPSVSWQNEGHFSPEIH